MSLSVIIPTWNEAAEIVDCLESLRQSFTGEIIAVDGESDDATLALAKPFARTISAKRGLARQCNAGARATDADWILFLAADSRLPQGWFDRWAEVARSPYVVAGGFRLQLDSPRWIYRILSFGGNFRARQDGLALGDQGLFVRRSAFDAVGGMRESAEIPFADICRELRRQGELVHLELSATSSVREWREKGLWQTTLRHVLAYRRFLRYP